MNYPDDDDGQALQMLLDDGVDMDAPLDIEFAVLYPNEAAAHQIKKVIAQAGYEAEIEFDEGELEDGEEMTEENEEFWPSWSVYVAMEMVPAYEEIIKMQERLDDLSQPHGGKSDGWGVMH